MKKNFLIIALIIACCFLTLKSSFAGKDGAGNRFQQITSEKLSSIMLSVVKDTQTGTEYLISSWGNGGGICKLEN